MDISIDEHLQTVLEWANGKILSQQEPPWALEEYNKLRAVLNRIIQSRAATIRLEDLQQQELHLESDHPQAENIVQLDIARLRRDGLFLQMPM